MKRTGRHPRYTDLTQAIVQAIQGGLPLVERPYAAIGRALGIDESEVIARISGLLADGSIRRLGVVVRHQELGYRANAMVVWDLPDARVDALGARIGTAEAMAVMDDLRAFGVPVLILSGGEPLMRPDLFDLARHAKSLGFYLALSTNGTLIDRDRIGQIAAVGFDYLGISLDGLPDTHDRFRRRIGAFQASLNGLRLCREAGIRVGLRFTLTGDNAQDLPALLRLMEEEGVHKFYLSHLNYAGRSNKNRGDDAHFRMTREAMDLLVETGWSRIQRGEPVELVTGNNDADGGYLLQWAQRRFPERGAQLRKVLGNWGGNASGLNIANIDNRGEVHPDTFWWDHPLGNVLDRPFSVIWEDRSDPLMAGLKERPRPVEGRCAGCAYLAICNGNTRTLAHQVSGDFWAEDPGCYLTDTEIGLASEPEPMLASAREARA